MSAMAGPGWGLVVVVELGRQATTKQSGRKSWEESWATENGERCKAAGFGIPKFKFQIWSRSEEGKAKGFRGCDDGEGEGSEGGGPPGRLAFRQGIGGGLAYHCWGAWKAWTGVPGLQKGVSEKGAYEASWKHRVTECG